MIRVVPELSEREIAELDRGRQKRELVEWLRAEAARRNGPMSWYVAHVSRRADSVADDLRTAGLDVVCPLRREWRRFPRSTRRYPVDNPLFGPLVFLRLLRAESAWVGALTFDGVEHLLGVGERPVPLTPAEEAQILAMVGQGDAWVAVETPALKVGDQVAYRLGKFSQLHGVVREVDPVRQDAMIETVLFGREIATRCGIDDLERLE